MPRFFNSIYYSSPRALGDRPIDSQLHKTRDGLAIGYVNDLLYGMGFKKGGDLLNVPEDRRPSMNWDHEERVLRSSILEEDIVIQVTRPPLAEWQASVADKKALSRRLLTPGGGVLEEHVLQAVHDTFLEECDRSTVTLRDDLDLSSHQERYRSIGFAIYHNAAMRMVEPDVGSNRAEDSGLTMGYLMSIAGVSKVCPRMVLVFGMGGTETLCFAYVLNTWFSDLFKEVVDSPRRLIMMTFRQPESAPYPMLRFERSDLCPQVVVDVSA